MILQFIIYIICVIFIINILYNTKENYSSNIMIKPLYGLCNKLQFTEKWINISRKRKRNLDVIWEVSDACPGFFLDYFQPINGVEFYHKTKYNKIIKRGWDRRKNPVYKEFKLLPYMQKKVNNNIRKLQKYIAIHVRRTDMVNHCKRNKWKIIPYIIYDKFINKYKNYNLYIATDNRETQNYFYKKYKNRVKVIKFINSNNNKRQTSLEDAIIDLYTCINANYFLGSNKSSFTKYIIHNRK